MTDHEVAVRTKNGADYARNVVVVKMSTLSKVKFVRTRRAKTVLRLNEVLDELH